MPLVKAQCTNCGANLEVDDSKDAAICPMCNTPYIVEKAIKNYINVSAGSDSLNSLIEAGNKFLGAKKWNKAYEFFKKAMDSYPSDYRGYWGMLQVRTKGLGEDFEDIYNRVMSRYDHEHRLDRYDLSSMESEVHEVEDLYQNCIVLAADVDKDKVTAKAEKYCKKLREDFQKVENRFKEEERAREAENEEIRLRVQRENEEAAEKRRVEEEKEQKRISSIRLWNQTIPVVIWYALAVCLLVPGIIFLIPPFTALGVILIILAIIMFWRGGTVRRDCRYATNGKVNKYISRKREKERKKWEKEQKKNRKNQKKGW